MKDVTFNISQEKGIITCLLGANGSGKSTLLDIIGGLIRPDEGSVALNIKNEIRVGPGTS